MRKKYFFLIVFIAWWVITSAQDKPGKFHFHSINSVALVNGSNAVSAALQTVNGFQHKSFFAGIGAGLDYYLYRTVPVFADLRYEWGKNRNKFFVYADGGINFSWAQDYFYVQPVIREGNRTNRFDNGLYADAGFGYAVMLKNKMAIILSAGYSHKGLKESYTYRDWRSGEWQTDVNTYRLNRIVLKTGWRF